MGDLIEKSTMQYLVCSICLILCILLSVQGKYTGCKHSMQCCIQCHLEMSGSPESEYCNTEVCVNYPTKTRRVETPTLAPIATPKGTPCDFWCALTVYFGHYPIIVR